MSIHLAILSKIEDKSLNFLCDTFCKKGEITLTIELFHPLLVSYFGLQPSGDLKDKWIIPTQNCRKNYL
jgi:hypothetical protein